MTTRGLATLATRYVGGKLEFVAAMASIVIALNGCSPTQSDILVNQIVDSFGQPVVVRAGTNALPATTLTVPDLGNGKIVLHSGDQPATVHLGPVDSFFLVAASEDPDGVQAVCFQLAEQRACTCSGIGLNQIIDYPDICYAMNVAPGGQALTRLWLPFLVDKRVHSACSPGCEGQDTFVVNALGRNFSGQESTTSPVTFINP
jgi:hypothetical protein